MHVGLWRCTSTHFNGFYKLRKVTISFVMSLSVSLCLSLSLYVCLFFCLSISPQAPTGRIVIKFVMQVFFEKPSIIFKINYI
jgi:hypothetical protein